MWHAWPDLPQWLNLLRNLVFVASFVPAAFGGPSNASLISLNSCHPLQARSLEARSADRDTFCMDEATRAQFAAKAFPFIPLAFTRHSLEESRQRAAAFYADMDRRRTTRQFSTEPVPRDLIEQAIRTAASAPSGAHQQPWTFVAVSDDGIKRAIRDAAEREEREFYHGRAPQDWIDALAPLGTDEHKPHLTDAPWVVVLFRQAYGAHADGRKRTLYYTQESCGIAAGFFIAAIHLMGLVTLTHTPSPMGFLGELLERPPNEKAMLVMPVGYPAPDARVPDLARKSLEEVAIWR
jgi:nitroreductase